MKKLFLLPVLALFSSVVLAQDVKFLFSVEGSNEASFRAEVFSDYTFAIQLPGTMDFSKINVTIALDNVASLGLKGRHEFNRSMEVELGTLDLSNILSNCYNFDGAVISLNVKDVTVSYALSRVENVITGVPDDVERARQAFRNLISQCEMVANDVPDSYIKLASGSGLAIANEAIVLNSDLVLFDGDWSMESVIDDVRTAVGDITDLGLEGAKTFSVGSTIAAGSVVSLGGRRLIVRGEIALTFNFFNAFTGDEMPNLLSVVQEIMNDEESGESLQTRTAKAFKRIIQHFDEVVGYVEEAGEVEAEAEVQEAPTAIETIGDNADASIRKAMVNGQLVIIRDGVRYNAIGQIAE